MENKIIKHKWFWAWQDDKEEQWLSDMSKQGYHLVRPGFFGRYEFLQGEPKNYVYRLDYMTGKRDDKESYLQYFADAGWTYLGEFGYWQYFRILAGEGENPEIYTDAASKIRKYYRILVYLVMFLSMYTIVLKMSDMLDYDPAWLMVGIFILWMAIILVFIFCIVRIFIRIQELKKTIKQ